MADFKLPNLPAGAKWGFADNPSDVPSPEQAQSNLDESIGSVLRQTEGPQRPVAEPPTFMSGVVKPTLEKAASLIPHTPLDVGLFAASTLLGGPGAIGAKVVGKLAPEAVPMIEALGSTGIRRILGMGTAGAALGAITGQGAGVGALEGIAQQIPGESLSKLTRWGRMNAQAMDLAKSDPQALGEIVQPIIPGLGKLKTANDFHAAFNNGGADRVASQAYRAGMNEVLQGAGEQQINSVLMSQMRNAATGVKAQPSGVNIAYPQGGLATMAGNYSLEDAMYTLKRLRKQGWNEDEIRQGMGAMDAREAADQLSKEIKSQLPPAVADKFSNTDGQYARAQSLIQYISDPDLLKKNGDLNIPMLQDKFKADGYNQRQSLQMTADAMALKDAIFRGSDAMATDVAGEKGKIFEHLRLHFGVIPTTSFSLPKLGSYAGQKPYGLDPFEGTQMGQLLKRGVDNRPVTLTDKDSE